MLQRLHKFWTSQKQTMVMMVTMIISCWLTYHIEAVGGEVVDDPVEAVHGGTWQVGIAGAPGTGDCGENRSIGNSHRGLDEVVHDGGITSDGTALLVCPVAATVQGVEAEGQFDGVEPKCLHTTRGVLGC